MIEEKCPTCKWSKVVGVHKEGNLPIVECRRFPPTHFLAVVNNQPQRITFFPLVDKDTSCGEWHVEILTN